MLLFICKRNQIQQKSFNKSGPWKAQNTGSDVSELRGPTDLRGSRYRKEKQKSRKHRRWVILWNFGCLQDSVPSTHLLIDNCCHLYFMAKRALNRGGWGINIKNALYALRQRALKWSSFLHCTQLPFTANNFLILFNPKVNLLSARTFVFLTATLKLKHTVHLINAHTPSVITNYNVQFT